MAETVEFEFPDEIEAREKKADDKLEIVVENDVPAVDRGRSRMVDEPQEFNDEELGKYDEGVKKRIQHFTKGFHQERRDKETANREKDEAMRFAQQTMAENQQLRGSLSQGHTALLAEAKKTIASELSEAKRKFKEAADSFDSDAMLEAQQELTAVSIKADKIENFRPAPLQTRENVVQPPQEAKQAPTANPKLESWLGANKWYGDNKRMTAYALGVHEDLIAEGIPAGSDHYYDKLDEDLQGRFPEQFTERGSVDAPTQRKSNIVSPATRSTAPRKIVLTQTQVNIAKRLGVPLELYARKVAEELRKI